MKEEIELTEVKDKKGKGSGTKMPVIIKSSQDILYGQVLMHQVH